jgi:small GTP-binding protein
LWSSIKLDNFIGKVCVVGEGGVGKSSLLNRLISGKFIQNMKMTIGTDLLTYQVIMETKKITYQLWDFAGEQRFRFFLPTYLKGAASVFICFDLTRFITFKNLDEWYQIVTQNTKDPIIYLIGTKRDLEDRRAVTKDVIESWMHDKRISRLFECSAATGENIAEVFKILGDDLLREKWQI